MNISAINVNNRTNFKGAEVDELAKSLKNITSKDFDSLEADDFNGVAQSINSAAPDNKFTKPIKYFIGTSALAIASFLASRKASLVTIKGMEGKFPLYSTIDKAGKYASKKFAALKSSVSPAKVKGVKTFLQNTANSAMEFVENYAKKGITEADRAIHKGPIAELYAKNAIRKTLASGVGLGAAGLTVATRTADENTNGIPDRAEKKSASTLGVIKDVAEALPVVAGAMNLS